jgi:hypothetical protein
MDHRVDDGFAEGSWRDVPPLNPADTPDFSAMHGVFLDEDNRLFDRSDQIGMYFGAVHNLALVDAPESASLNPRIGKVPLAVGPN